MINKLLFPALFLLFGFSVHAQQQTVYVCPNNQKTADILLKQAIQETVSGDESVSFLSENNPCSYSRGIKTHLNATIGKNYFNLASNHAFSLIRVDGKFFSIEQFIFKTEKQANSISQILAKRKNNMLQTEGVTFYDYFLTRNTLVFYLADGQVYKKNLPLFQKFKDNFLKESQ